MDERIVKPMSRRRLLKYSAGAGAAMLNVAPAEAGPSFKERFSATYLDRGEIAFALLTDHLRSIEPLLDEYTTTTGTKINVDPHPYNNLYTKLNIAVTQSTGAYDVVSLEDPWIPQFAGGDFLVKIDDEHDNAADTADLDFVPAFLALGAFPPGSGISACPWFGNVQVFAYWTDSLEAVNKEVPTTWDDVLEAATTITASSGGDGRYGVGLCGLDGNTAATSFLPILRGFGKDVIDRETSEPQLDTREAMQAIDILLMLRGQAPPDVQKVGHVENWNHLYNGTVAMSGDIWSGQILGSPDPVVSKPAGNLAVARQPAQAGAPPSTMSGNWLLAIPDGSRNVERALEFITWFTAPKQQMKLLFNGIPATRISVLRDPEAVEHHPFLPQLLAIARSARPRPRTPQYRAMEEIYGRYVAEAIAGVRSGADALRAANRQIRELLIREGVLG